MHSSVNKSIHPGPSVNLGGGPDASQPPSGVKVGSGAQARIGSASNLLTREVSLLIRGIAVPEDKTDAVTVFVSHIKTDPKLAEQAKEGSLSHLVSVGQLDDPESLKKDFLASAKKDPEATQQTLKALVQHLDKHISTLLDTQILALKQVIVELNAEVIKNILSNKNIPQFESQSLKPLNKLLKDTQEAVYQLQSHDPAALVKAKETIGGLQVSFQAQTKGIAALASTDKDTSAADTALGKMNDSFNTLYTALAQVTKEGASEIDKARFLFEISTATEGLLEGFKKVGDLFKANADNLKPGEAGQSKRALFKGFCATVGAAMGIGSVASGVRRYCRGPFIGHSRGVACLSWSRRGYHPQPRHCRRGFSQRRSEILQRS